MRDRRTFWRHPRFPDLGLMKARFTRHRYDRHAHPTYVIALITDGAEQVGIGKRSVVAPAGTMIVVNPEEVHDGEAATDDGWAYRTFYPSVPLMSSVAAELGEDGPPLFTRPLIADPGVVRALAVAHETSRAGEAADAEGSLLIALRWLIHRHGDRRKWREPIGFSGAGRRLALYRHVVERDLAIDVDLQRLATLAGVTRFQVIRDFKRETGLTPATFIRNRRLRFAAHLIAQGASLSDAALQAGFADQSHLSRTFQAIHGITPGMFKASWPERGSRQGRSAPVPCFP